MKYLSFDIEIARGLGKMAFGELKPNNGEKIEVLLGPDEKNDWRKGIYQDNEIFVMPEREVRTEGLFWRLTIDLADWKRFRPLGITCAAAASSDGSLWNWWAAKRGKFTTEMAKGDCQLLVLTLEHLVDQGFTLLTWNGLGFDFDILGEESGMHEECKGLALNHIDMMFHFFASKGFPLGLDAASKGMGLPGKPEGMDGAMAPVLWANGEYHRVLSYNSLDAENTLGLAQAVDNAGYLGWTAKSGRPNTWHCDRWMTVKEAMGLPLPDTSWMSDPWGREKFYGWTGVSPDPMPGPPAGTPHHPIDLDYDLMEEEEAKEIGELFDPTGMTQWDPDEGTWEIWPDET